MRRPEIDFLRFIAVLLVLGHHAHPVVTNGQPVGEVFGFWHRCGWVGVDLFFVLSGFLVTGLLLHEHSVHHKVDVKRFLVRRGFKIYPSFWVFLVVSVLFGWLMERGVGWKQVVAEFLFVQNYATPMWNHTWSLAVEEHFYILLAILACVLGASKAATRVAFQCLPWISLVIGAVCLFGRAFNAVQPYALETHVFPTHLRLDSLAFGMALAYWWRFDPLLQSEAVRRFRWGVLSTGGLLLLPAGLFQLESPWVTVWGFTLFYLGSGLVLVGAMHCKMNREGIVATCAHIGTFSYSIYLWHMFVQNWLMMWIMNLIPAPIREAWIIYFTLYLGLAIGVGVLACRIIELPCLYLRDRYFPSRSGAVSSVEHAANVTPAPTEPVAVQPASSL